MPKSHSRSKLNERRWFRSTRFWSATGATLGVLATLWATLIGETIPQIVSSSHSPIAEFRRAANSACAPLPQYVTSVFELDDSRVRIYGRPHVYPSHVVRALAERVDLAVYRPIEGVASTLLTVEAPTALAPEYARFRERWTVLTRALLSLVSSTYELSHPAPGYQRVVRALLTTDSRAFRLATDEIEDAAFLGLRSCIGGIAGVTFELQTLGQIAQLQQPVVQDPDGLWKLAPIRSCPEATIAGCSGP